MLLKGYATTIKVLSLLSALCLSLAAHQQSAPEIVSAITETEAVSDLKLSLELLGDEFHLNGKVRFRVRLTNVGKESITVYKNLETYSGLQIILADARGGERDKGNFIEPPSSRHPFKKEDFPDEFFTTLAPGSTYTSSSYIWLPSYGLEGPGEYMISATCDNRVPARFLPQGVTVWGVKSEKLKTKPLKFKVIE
jgi:hypothetical protein